VDAFLFLLSKGQFVIPARLRQYAGVVVASNTASSPLPPHCRIQTSRVILRFTITLLPTAALSRRWAAVALPWGEAWARACRRRSGEAQ